MSIMAEIAQHTVALTAAHLLVETGKGTLQAGTEAAGKLLPWLRKKLIGPAKAALDMLEADPKEETSQAALRVQLVKLLETNPTLLAELRSLLPPALATETTIQSQTVGNHSRAVQNKGNNNTTTISG